jgi:hypothetical protein
VDRALALLLLAACSSSGAKSPSAVDAGARPRPAADAGAGAARRPAAEGLVVERHPDLTLVRIDPRVWRFRVAAAADHGGARPAPRWAPSSASRE